MISLIKKLMCALAPPGLFPYHWGGRKLLPALVQIPLVAGMFSLVWRAALVTAPAGLVKSGPGPAVSLSERPGELVIMSANLWHDWPRHRDIMERMEAFARLAENKGAEVILVQEAAQTATIDVPAWLANRLGMTYVYARANGHQAGIGFEEGVAILSRYPIEAPQVYQLSEPTNPFSRRVALAAKILAPRGHFRAVSVHLGLFPQGNARQVERLQAWVEAMAQDGPVVVGGDFNAVETSAQIQTLQLSWVDTYRAIYPGVEADTHRLYWPWGTLMRTDRLDYIFLHPGSTPWEAMDAAHLETESIAHSDHKVIMATIRQVEDTWAVPMEPAP